jgi:hypothetical protein
MLAHFIKFFVTLTKKIDECNSIHNYFVHIDITRSSLYMEIHIKRLTLKIKILRPRQK